MHSNIFDDVALERLRREAVPSSNENATAEDVLPQVAEQPAHVDAAVNTPKYASRKLTATSLHSPKQEESGCREGSEPNAGDLFGSQPGPLRYGLNSFCRRAGSLPYYRLDALLAKVALSQHGEKELRSVSQRLEPSGNNRSRIVRTVRMAFGTNVSLSQPDIIQKLTERIDDLKQRIAAWGKRFRRYTERSTQFNQNRLFQSDQKRLYESLEQTKVCGAGQEPDHANIITFWRGLWSETVNHSEGPWMEVVASQGASVTPMDHNDGRRD
ncbi:unnamed protein product [Parnassius apollo]|uniref:(apollo) hypothetical protein n=1 Tax=Parnassius apollo TaxID=110799 RepID=A0A8S3XZD4_PARAO|nr:unnamed protein product [Parnassius apollo]